MPARRLDADLDRLYQLPAGEFTAARNALAKAAGAAGASIRSLEKPAVAAWAVNQLYWQRRATYDALIHAAEKVRAAHKAVLSGRTADLRDTGQAHEKQIELATKATLTMLAEQGHPVTDATRQAIATTLRALPGEGPAGRLTHPLQPGGFEMLAHLRPSSPPRRPAADASGYGGQAGLSLSPGVASKRKHEPVRTVAAPSKGKPVAKPVNTKALVRAREAAVSAGHEVRGAEHTAKRAEFEMARASRDAERTTKAVEHAREARDLAQQAFDDAEAAAAKALRARDAAASRATQADEALDSARARAAAAQATVRSLERG